MFLQLLLVIALPTADRPVDYTQQIKPLLTKYCVGCHDGEDSEGELSLSSFEDMLKGGLSGVAVVPGDSKQSRLLHLMTGGEPKMPPADNPTPTAEEIGLIRRWIDEGAKGPEGAEPLLMHLNTPPLPPASEGSKSIAAVAYSPAGTGYAVGRYKQAELYSSDGKVQKSLPHPGKVLSVRYSNDGRWLITASGITGLYGEARIYNTNSGELAGTFRGHRDVVYAAITDPQGKRLATASYDRAIVLWDVATGEKLRILDGHNDAVYDLAFSPDGTVLASASGDSTVKLWRVEDGQRLDTFSQPLKEQYTVAFSPDGRYVVAGGVDNRIRVWRFLSRTEPRINPIVYSRFGHEQAIVDLKFTRDGRRLISVSEDRNIKVWETETFTEIAMYEQQPGAIAEIAIAPDDKTVLVGRLDGSLQQYPMKEPLTVTGDATKPMEKAAADVSGTPTRITESEPNDRPENATPLQVPAIASGIIGANGDQPTDVDLYRFQAKAGQQFVLEVRAARDKSPLDSKIEVLNSKGEQVVRLYLQAVRDSYITFRGINSETTDVRVHNWEEMQLNQYLYFEGEVCKLYRMPRGPDSGVRLYPEEGRRLNYFDTSATTHALNEPCYVVEPIPVGAPVIPNGLPVFPVYFQNDDDAERELGTDSRLTFTAPEDGEYLVRVSDVRDFSGPDFKYALTVRPPKPDFNVTINEGNPAINVGSGKAISFMVDRIDGFNGEVRIDIDNLPRGFHVTTPIIIQAGHVQAWGTIFAEVGAVNVSPAEVAKTKVTATAVIDGKEVRKKVGKLRSLQVAGPPDAYVSLTPYGQPAPEPIGRHWQPLAIEQATAANGSQLTVRADNTVLAGGENPQNESYTVVAKGVGSPILAVRLDALSDPSLPANGPGRAPNGNFVLTEVRLGIAPADKPDEVTPLPIAAAGADFAQKSLDAQGLIDGKDETGWAVAEENKGKYTVKATAGNPSHYAVFELQTPLTLNESQRLVAYLDQKSSVAHHNLGKFRLSVTSDPATAPFKPAVIEIFAGQTIEATLRVDRQGFKGRIGFEDRNLPHGVIVDNIGLNGVLITEEQSERTIYLTAYHWVEETERLFFLESKEVGKQTTWPVLLRVKRQP